MIADLKPYPSMKESGVEWLENIPEHWRLPRLGALLRERGETNGDGQVSEVLSVLRERGVIPYAEKGNIGNKKSEDITRYKVVRPDDIVVNCMNVIIGSVGLSRYTGCLSPVYYVLTRRSEHDHPRYLNAYFQTKPFQESLARIGNGILAHRMRIPMELLKCEPFPRPSFEEQAAIVRFLDHADRRIRRYIRAKQKLITLLEEQKQAIIHQAVTGQVDVRTGQLYPAYKPSGVEWLGDVPEHWESARLKAFLLRPMRNGLFKKKDAFGSGAPLVNVADIYQDSFQIDPASLDRVQTTPDELRTYQVRTGDLFFVRSSLKLEGTGRSAVAIDCEAGSVFECHLVQGRPDSRRAVARFLAFQLNSFSLRHYMISRANVVTMATVSQGVLASCPVFLPSISEQEGLLKQIDGECARVAATHDRAHRQIDLLREYRTRLIADVVTGKIDVREEEARLPEVDSLADEFDALTTQAAASGMMELEDATETLEELAMENEATV